METTEQTITVPLSELIALRDRFTEISQACVKESDAHTDKREQDISYGKAYGFSSAASHVSGLIHDHEPQDES